jgi:hypothetical protein
MRLFVSLLIQVVGKVVGKMDYAYSFQQIGLIFKDKGTIQAVQD